MTLFNERERNVDKLVIGTDRAKFEAEVNDLCQNGWALLNVHCVVDNRPFGSDRWWAHLMWEEDDDSIDN